MEEKEEQSGEGDTGLRISPKVFVALALPIRNALFRLVLCDFAKYTCNREW